MPHDISPGSTNRGHQATTDDAIAENLASVRSRIESAARRAGRDPDAVTLIAVAKTFNAEYVRAAWQAGQRDFGENKVQEAERKMTDAAALSDIRWHLIGHLQSNKAKKATAFAMIHSIDSLEVLHKLDAAAAAAGRGPEVLIQVDLAGEHTKFGVAEEQAEQLARAALDMQGVRLSGLMLLPPWSENPEQTRPWFARLRSLRERLIAAAIPAEALRHLSMGMSHDFEAAIEEGATIVRVGTAIFGKRVKP